MHDFAGCDTSSVLAAVGLSFEDLFPARQPHQTYSRVRRPFNAIDILRCVVFETLIAAVAAGNLAKGMTLSEQDYERLFVAASLLQQAVEVANHA